MTFYKNIAEVRKAFTHKDSSKKSRQQANIKINCGYCAKRKGCEFSKAFRNLAKSFEYIGYEKVFELKCPFIEQKYKSGDALKFTYGVGLHQGVVNWQCTWDCDSCSDSRCNEDGEIKLYHNAYNEYLELKGVVSHIPKKGYVAIFIPVKEFEKVKSKFNKNDTKRLKMYNDIGMLIDYNEDKYSDFEFIFFISKFKYINLLDVDELKKYDNIELCDAMKSTDDCFDSDLPW